MLDKRHMNPEIWETPSAPVVFGERIVPGATRTILFYIHFDGQPIEPARWKQPDPFTPVLRAGSLDDGAPPPSPTSPPPPPSPTPGASTPAPPATTKVPSKPSSVPSSPSTPSRSPPPATSSHPPRRRRRRRLIPRLRRQKISEKLHSDVLIILDGPQHPSGQQTIYYGDRSGAGLELTVYTAKTSMHSGNYGNWLPDANVRLAQLIASMVDPTGRVLIKDFYSDIPPFSPRRPEDVSTPSPTRTPT